MRILEVRMGHLLRRVSAEGSLGTEGVHDARSMMPRMWQVQRQRPSCRGAGRVHGGGERRVSHWSDCLDASGHPRDNAHLILENNQNTAFVCRNKKKIWLP